MTNDPAGQPPVSDPGVGGDGRDRKPRDPHRPAYHFLPEANWMNDPNGAIQWKGRYHLFYQHNPHGAFHATMHWGHAVSTDLVHWTHLPIALTPTPDGPDQDGCFSGYAVNNDGIATLVYTGVRGHAQLTCIATSTDEFLVNWTKYPGNPVIEAPPPNLDLVAYRDHSVWREDHMWYQVIGGGIRGVGGTSFLYRSPDLIHWEYLQPILLGDLHATDPVWTGEMWECPDLFSLDGRHVLMVSVWHESRLHYAVYMVGGFDGRNFTVEQQGITDPGGSFYAPQTFLDDHGRRIMWGWLREDRSVEAQIGAGWSGVMALPRILFITSSGHLGQRPVPELQALRGKHISMTEIDVSPQNLTALDGVRGDTLEIVAELELRDAAAVDFAVRCSPGYEEQTIIRYDRRDRKLIVDRTQSSLDHDTIPVVASTPLDLADGEPLRLHIFLDRSVMEVFANDRVCIASRLYPARPDSLGVSLRAQDGTAHLLALHVWALQAL